MGLYENKQEFNNSEYVQKRRYILYYKFLLF